SRPLRRGCHGLSPVAFRTTRLVKSKVAARRGHHPWLLPPERSGRDDEALHRAKVTGATLIVAKLDRLSRDLAFLANLQKSGVHFLAEMPEANELTIHVMAALAQHERRMISERTRQTLAVAKRRGQARQP